MSDKKRKEELKEKYEAIFSGEQKRLKSNKIDHDFDSRLTNLEESVKTIIQNQDKLKEVQNQILKEQTELKELVCAYQKMTVDELKLIMHQTKNNEEINFLNDVIKEVAKTVFTTSIYAEKDELSIATRTYLNNSHSDFFQKFNVINWDVYFNNNILTTLTQKIRSERGSFTSKVKDAIFSYFNELPRINTADSPAEIMKWKRNVSVAKCYDKLFSNNYKALVEIVSKVFNEKMYSELQMAYVISICTTFLDPKNNHIKCKESSMKKKINFYLDKIESKRPIEPDNIYDNDEYDNDEKEERNIDLIII